MRIAIALPGLHRVNRGAETAFQALGTALAERDHAVTLFGSGEPTPHDAYEFIHVPSRPRERFQRWPTFPPVRSPIFWEEFAWVPGLMRTFRPDDFDVSVTCSFPFVNMALRTRRGLARRSAHSPAHVFVTENGDWPAVSNRLEYRLFGCDGLVCTNATYADRNRDEWLVALIPNGVDTERFAPGPGDRARFGLPEGPPIVLMVSALDAGKRVDAGIRAVAELSDAILVVAGEGPERDALDRLAADLIPGRFHRLSIDSGRMPDLYRVADVLLHTTLLESFGNVYVEAIASGVPLVAHRSAHTEWIAGDSDLLVDTESIDATTDALRRGLARHDGGLLIDRRFTWASIAEDYEQFFETVLAGRSGW